ncbi:cysteine--tRNA ligase [Nonomuraea roseoviolacea]|uniref:Cysteinyl-tRNA synthetase n=1 Tax=Nonomuraea roseoviolacea subsp. carminata TaxID=160689 RepID=A0ABT1K4H5_9ACTN|nr:cysteine--tRNA ligase [Nonomuraea roseoviolacea]MCP2348487.1 cysteinyl-tRNA synthetase [Nonomuraea roseoviolacea subsp. carminata]
MLRIHDSRTGTIREIGAGRALRMYACVPSVDGRPRLGELRPLLVADLIRRVLERGRVRVLACRPRGLAPGGSSPETGERDAADLNVRPAEQAPLPDETVLLAVRLVDALLERGHAYAVPGGPVLFDAGTYPGLSVDATAGGEEAVGRRSPGDWVLWRPAGAEPSWESPWGRGVPGPHVACSGVALGLLGGRVDVHVGGGAYDDRERAQSDAAAGHEVVRHWVRTAEVSFDGGSVDGGSVDGGSAGGGSGGGGSAAGVDGGTSLADVVAAGLDPLAVRMAFLEHHHRRPVALTWDALRAADRAVRHWRARVARWSESPSAPMAAEYVKRVEAAFEDDLDTPGALRVLRELEEDASVSPGARFEAFLHVDQVLGLDLSADIGRTP